MDRGAVHCPQHRRPTHRECSTTGAGFGFRDVGERPVDLSNTLTLSDYVVLDAAVFYRRGRLSIDVNFKNLTSETYFNGNGTFVFPGEPFSVLGRVGWSF
jgi:outer membrane receptor for ferric coprogen and ferric-rhodotorulic acid